MATETLTGAQALIRSLELLGVDTVFGLPGGAILPTYDPLMDSKKLRHILSGTSRVLVTLPRDMRRPVEGLEFALQPVARVLPTW